MYLPNVHRALYLWELCISFEKRRKMLGMISDWILQASVPICQVDVDMMINGSSLPKGVLAQKSWFSASTNFLRKAQEAQRKEEEAAYQVRVGRDTLRAAPHFTGSDLLL